MKITIRIVIVIFLVSGILHLVNPQSFLWLMPPWIPDPIAWIFVSGVLEIICAVGLFFRQKWAGWLTVLVLVAIWPANIWYAFDTISSNNLTLILAAWVRLPLQLPLIYYSYKFATATRE